MNDCFVVVRSSGHLGCGKRGVDTIGCRIVILYREDLTRGDFQ